MFLVPNLQHRVSLFRMIKINHPCQYSDFVFCLFLMRNSRWLGSHCSLKFNILLMKAFLNMKPSKHATRGSIDSSNSMGMMVVRPLSFLLLVCGIQLLHVSKTRHSIVFVVLHHEGLDLIFMVFPNQPLNFTLPSVHQAFWVDQCVITTKEFNVQALAVIPFQLKSISWTSVTLCMFTCWQSNFIYSQLTVVVGLIRKEGRKTHTQNTC